MQAHDRTFDAAAGRVLAFDARVPHSVEAVKPSTLLLTLATEHG